MITKDNLDEILNKLTIEEITRELDKNGDFVLLEIDISNAGYSVNLISSDYSQYTNNRCNANGDLFCDKDDFLLLLSKSNSKHKNIIY